MPRYIVEDRAGQQHLVEELQRSGSEFIHVCDAGPAGKVRRYADEAEGLRFYVNEGPSLGERAIELPLPPVVVDTPAITVDGTMSTTAAVGQKLSCTQGNWANEPSAYSYSWRRDGVEFGVGVNETYLVAVEDAGSSIGCVVSASNAAGTTEAPPSNSVSVAAQRSASHDERERRVPRRQG